MAQRAQYIVAREYLEKVHIDAILVYGVFFLCVFFFVNLEFMRGGEGIDGKECLWKSFARIYANFTIGHHQAENCSRPFYYPGMFYSTTISGLTLVVPILEVASFHLAPPPIASTL